MVTVVVKAEPPGEGPTKMPLRTKVQVALTLLVATGAVLWAAHLGSHAWLPFWLLLAASLLSSGMVVELPKNDGVMSVNFPFILMGLIVLSPLQALLLASLSVAAQSRVRVRTLFTAVQISFNIANATVATACAYMTFAAVHRLNMASAPGLALASVAYFLWNTGTFAAIIAPSKGEGVLKLWWTQFPWYLPFYLLGASLAALTDWLAVRFGWTTALMLIPATYALYRTYRGQSAQLQERELRLRDTEALHLRIIEGLAMAIEAKDQGTHDHLFRVRNYVQSVGEKLGLNALEMQALQTASFLHDIGKLAVPEEIINKPGRLTPEEFEKMKIHPSVGAEILERVRFPYPVVPIVRSHHEWWNGAGYPDGLKGSDIPIGARVLTVVDCFDALVSDRPYRKGMSSAKAMDLIRSLSGKQFDPDIVAAFESSYAAAETLSGTVSQTSFTALNTEPEVWRGIAPGAGFQAGSEANGPASLGSSSQVSQPSETIGEVESLVLIASASQEAHTLFELSQAFGQSLSAAETLSISSARIAPLIPHDACVLYLKRGDFAEAVSWAGEAARHFAASPIPLGVGVSGWVAQSAKPLLNGNATVEPGCPHHANGTPVFRSALSFPLSDLHGQLFAVLTLYARQADCFQRHHLRVLQAMESKLALAFGNAIHQPSTAATETDFQTGLPNAGRFFLQLESELEAHSRHDSALAVTLCDLSALGVVQQKRGQLAGNRLLCSVADELRRNVQGTEIVARTGHEEFAFLFSASGEADIDKRLESLQASLAAAMRRSGHTSSLDVHLGTALYPADGTTAEALLACANRRIQRKRMEARDSTPKTASTTHPQVPALAT